MVGTDKIIPSKPQSQETEIAQALLAYLATCAYGEANFKSIFSNLPKYIRLTPQDWEVSRSRPAEKKWHSAVRNIGAHANNTGNPIREGTLIKRKGGGFRLASKVRTPIQQGRSEMATLIQEKTARPRRKKAPAPTPIAVLEHVKFEFRLISKSDLTIPTDEYQRDESNGLIAKDIALHFNKVAFGALTVIECAANGGKPLLKVADGGTRLSAARMREDQDKLPCLVFRGLTKEEEADVFLAINQNRQKLRVEQLQNSEVCAGRAHAVKVDEILNGFQTARIDFSALSALRACVKRMPLSTDVVVKILGEVAGDKHLSVRVFKGLVHLQHHLEKYDRTLNEPSRRAKLQKTFGALDGFVNAALSTHNSRSSDPMVCAKVIARTIGINFPKREL